MLPVVQRKSANPLPAPPPLPRMVYICTLLLTALQNPTDGVQGKYVYHKAVSYVAVCVSERKCHIYIYRYMITVLFFQVSFVSP